MPCGVLDVDGKRELFPAVKSSVCNSLNTALSNAPLPCSSIDQVKEREGCRSIAKRHVYWCSTRTDSSTLYHEPVALTEV